jgi:hypothetical protein
MLRRLLPFALLAALALTGPGGCSPSKPTGSAGVPAGDVKGKENKSGNRTVGAPQ